MRLRPHSQQQHLRTMIDMVWRPRPLQVQDQALKCPEAIMV